VETPVYLVQRHRVWWAFHDVPPKLRVALCRRRFWSNLQTPDRGQARILGAVCEARWLREIERARHGTNAADEAAVWRERLARVSTGEDRRVIEDLILDAGAARVGLLDWTQKDEPGFEEEREALARWVGLATGDVVPFGERLDKYTSTMRDRIEAKSLHMKRTNLDRFAAIFTTTADIQRPAIQQWIYAEAERGAARATIVRAVSDLRGYHRYLVGVGAASDTPDPFDRLTMAGAKRVGRIPFDPLQVVQLEAKARAGEDGVLADFILLAMYTGARAEEIATLRCGHIDLARGAIAVPGTKTKAAARECPIHPAVAPTLRRLVAAANGGHLFQGLRPTQFDDRADALTKRFRTLAKGVAREGQVFHSIRATVCTILENAGVPENVSADIVGHEKPRITYGLYSGGTSLAVKAKALAKLAYPA
jgi:integrase